jgi:hypothetical protein
MNADGEALYSDEEDEVSDANYLEVGKLNDLYRYFHQL